MEVKAWTERISIPTYSAGQPEKNPMFLEKRVYQGSSGVVYPHPVIEQIADEKTDIFYDAVFLENEYLMIMILPELGGRIQRAYDKLRKRDFVYYNQVVKPALVGLAGPWISGGIEFNWPQHHRPSTFLPVDVSIEEGADGSKTVWVNETEVMFRTKGMAGFTLYPDKAYLEIKGKLFNRSHFPQTFLWWANPAVKVNEHYRSVFPPDVYAVFDHGKRDVSDFPIATGTYYKVNYAPGTDISRYDTIPVPTSYMAIASKYDFMGSYEDDSQAGMLHVADHHFSPGKKQWTWGNGEFGQAWDRNLTDEDGPYIELMTGVFTDNQPDFSWIYPNEVKSFEQYFMPYAQIGVVKNATKEAMLNLSFERNQLTIQIYSTAVYENASITLEYDGKLIITYEARLSPEKAFEQTFAIGTMSEKENWKVTALTANGEELVSYQPEKYEEKPIPKPAEPAKAPEDIEQVEDLFLNGLHLEQYRHATYNPMDYYDEGLKRSSGDIRCNNAKGLLLLRRGQFKASEPYFRQAIATLTKRNPNPFDGEPYYNLGWALNLQGRHQEAFEQFYKATWNDAWQHNAFIELARIKCMDGQWQQALVFIDRSLVRNYHSVTARHLKAAILRKLDQIDEASELISGSLLLDHFNFGCLYEEHLNNMAVLGDAATSAIAQLKQKTRLDTNSFLELALDYKQAGLYDDAISLLSILIENKEEVSPMVYYYQGWFMELKGDHDLAITACKKARQLDLAFCFPNKVEEILILENAIALDPGDAGANYLLGDLWYDKRQYAEAIGCWETSADLDQNFPTVYRNLSLAYYNKRGEQDKALEYLEKAFAMDPSDARVLMELDQLRKLFGHAFADRLNTLLQYPRLTEKRDDLYLEMVTLYNNIAEFEKAKSLLASRKFHPWEGGEGKVIGQYLLCHIELAKKAIIAHNFDEATALLDAASNYPENLGEGKLYGTPQNDIDYLRGLIYEQCDQKSDAAGAFRRASIGNLKPQQAIYYNDPQPDKIIYTALALLKTGETNKALATFESFISFGAEHADAAVKIDYFAVSLPDMLVFDIDLNERNRIFCKYITALGELGLENFDKATVLLEQVLELDINHQGAAVHLRMIPFLKQVKTQSANEY